MSRLFPASALALALLAMHATPGSAQLYRFHHVYRPHEYRPHRPADWWNRGQWRHGFHAGYYGWWWVIGTSWYLYPQPVYPYPPTILVTPAPVAPPPPTQPYCRKFLGDATIDGSNQPFYGTACLQPDGKWHIVN